jgi:(R,R)-butanediol dehydrogenase/meso-butanediol dehydrogenase/diacetyl reductase
MRALTVTDSFRLAVSDVAAPEPGPGHVVVRVSACGICGSDLHLMEARVMPAGVVMGHEASGLIEAVGDGVDGLTPGARVAINPFDACGECNPCRTGAEGRCINNAMTTIGLGLRPGAYAELIDVSAQMAVPVGGDVPLELISVAEPLAVALHGFNRSRFEPGMSVGVIGCGPIGWCAVMVAKLLGAGSVWASDPNEFRAELAGRVGADEFGASPTEADVVIECAGAPGTIDLAVSSARAGGQVAVLAVNMKGDNVFPVTWIMREVDILPCLAYSRAEYTQCAEWIASGAVDVAPIVTRRVSLDEADEAFFELLDGVAEGKVLVTP